MGVFEIFFLVCALGMAAGDGQEEFFQKHRQLAKALVEALQDTKFDNELLFDLKKENQIYPNRTLSFVIKYIVKRRIRAVVRKVGVNGKSLEENDLLGRVIDREVDNYRARRTDAISRRIYSSLVMKLIDIAKDLPQNSSAVSRIETAHRFYMSVESQDMHDKMADVQVFHACVRLYDIMFTAPRILSQLGPLDDLTPRQLVRRLSSINVHPVHVGVALLIQFHLRNTVNFAISSNALEVLTTKPQMVGYQVIDMLKALATRLLPVADLLDIHLAHSSPAFKDTCPSTWLGIVNNKKP